MNRGYLVLGAAVVLVAAFGLYVALGTGEDAAGKRNPGDPRIAGADHGRRDGRTSAHPDRAQPALPAGAAGPAGTGARDYTVGDVRVRDHRSGENAPLEAPPAIHPPEGRKIPSQLTSDLAQHLRGVMDECAAGVPREALGASSRLEGAVLMSIKNHQATVTNATFQLRDVAPASQDALKQCMAQKAVGVAAPSGDEPDVEGYEITLSFRLP
jgi:hypothetical protein